MKFLILFAIFSSTAFSNTIESVYNEDSVIHEELKAEVIEEVTKKYPCIDNYGLTEKSTDETLDQIDYGIRDFYYKTVFQATYHYDYHPYTKDIVVESARHDIDNPKYKRTEVISIESNISCD